MRTDAQTLTLIAGLIVVAVIAIAALFFYQRMRSRRLERQFGPEYERAIDQLGSRTKAEAELETRRKRVGKLKIVELSSADAARFDQAWKALQGRFVDNPKGVLGEADQLIRDLMLKRGYPMGDFERRAADISVDHPTVVGHYRAAQAIAMRDERGEADTEELRRAIVHYRALFHELLEVKEREAPMQPQHVEVRS
jgi:hypothetical protein